MKQRPIESPLSFAAVSENSLRSVLLTFNRVVMLEKIVEMSCSERHLLSRMGIKKTCRNTYVSSEFAQCRKYVGG